MDKIPDDVRTFIFECVDSVTQIEILFLLHKNPGKSFDAPEAAKELRANLDSTTKYLEQLHHSGLLAKDGEKFRFQPKDDRLSGLVESLVATYKIRPHKVMELIFSTAKRARIFAEAFNLTKPSSEGEDNG